jgi:hypothetical protein
MGFAISWIAFKEKTVTQVAETLGLAPSGELEEVPESLFSGVQLNTGWYVVFINEYGHRFVSERSLGRASEHSDVVAANVEEHVMFSSAEGWKSGKLAWKVSHNPELGLCHLEEQGEHPLHDLEIKQRLLASQQHEDQGEHQIDFVFDIPLELAEAIVGFKHDKVMQERFEVLKPASSSSGSGLLARLFRET